MKKRGVYTKTLPIMKFMINDKKNKTITGKLYVFITIKMKVWPCLTQMLDSSHPPPNKKKNNNNNKQENKRGLTSKAAWHFVRKPFWNMPIAICVMRKVPAKFKAKIGSAGKKLHKRHQHYLDDCRYSN